MKSSVYVFLSIIMLFVSYYIIKKPLAASAAAIPDFVPDKEIQLAMEYLNKNTLESGRFVYNSNVDPKIKYDNIQYNALRHAGTLYSMYLAERYLKNYSLQEKRYLASKYFIDNYIKSLKSDMYAVVSKPEEEKLSAPVAKLGGTGLALIGLSNLYPEGRISLDMLRGMGEFVLFMQKTDGSFYSKYNLEEKDKDKEFVSLYYPGEAALGLLYLNEVDPQKKWVEAAKKTLIYLANSRKGKTKGVPFDHWAMLATKKLFETPDNGLLEEEKLLLQAHAAQMANVIIYNQIVDEGNTYRGGFIDNFRLCSIGTMMEGLVAIYYVADDEMLKQQVLFALKLGTEFLSRYQVKGGDSKGGIPADAYWTLIYAPKASQVIRIDNVQHVLSAWITFRQLEIDFAEKSDKAL